MLDQSHKHRSAKQELPGIPDKLYFTIGEVSQLCHLKSHVLRYWEQEFSQLKPSKRKGNRRYYQRKDVVLVREIMSLLYEQGFTIEGARSKLSGDKNQDGSFKASCYLIQETIGHLESILKELES
jgi:DNA-binding transcriptional MerR regulator